MSDSTYWNGPMSEAESGMEQDRGGEFDVAVVGIGHWALGTGHSALVTDVIEIT
jgi:hypothetical protein